MPTARTLGLMTEVETIIAEAAKLPLRDAAFSLWRQRPRLETLEARTLTINQSTSQKQRLVTRLPRLSLIA